MAHLVGKFLVSELDTYEVPVGKNQLRGYLTQGKPNPLIHFVHGTGFCGLTYWPFLKNFAKDFNLLIHDVQGHGMSTSAGKFVGWNGSAKGAHRVIDAHESWVSQGPLIGVGHSFGAVVTLLMAAQRPERFAGLVLLDPVLFPKKQLRMMALLGRLGLLRFNPMAKQARRRTPSWTTREKAHQYLHERGIFKGWSGESLDAYVDHALHHHDSGRVSLKCDPEMEAALFSSYPAKLWRSIANLKVPTVMVRGDRGYSSLRKTVPLAAAMNPKVQVEVVRGGHCFMQEAPQQTAEYVRGLIARILP